MLLRVRKAWLDLRMGKCSGFPSCCVAFFTFVWSPFVWNAGEARPMTWYQKWYLERIGPFEYIPCPLCLLSGSRVKVRRCTDSCGHLEECRRLYFDD